MLDSLAEAAAAMQHREWLDAAIANGEFLLSRPAPRRRPMAPVVAGATAVLATSPTPPTTRRSCTRSPRLAEATGQARWIAEAVTTADAMLDLFWDPEEGGVFTTGDDGEALVTRPKDLLDNATPSANSLAALGLLRLAALTGDRRYQHHAEQILLLVGSLATTHPLAFPELLSAVDLHRSGATEIAVVGDRPDLVAAVHALGTCPTPCSRGASRTSRRCGSHEASASRTCVATTPASPLSTRSRHSSPSSRRAGWSTPKGQGEAVAARSARARRPCPCLHAGDGPRGDRSRVAP